MRINTCLQPKAYIIMVALSVLVLAASVSTARADLISVDLGTTSTFHSPQASPTYSGAESAATAANPAFGAAKVWNGLDVPEYNQTPVTNPIFRIC